ncbi:MAG: hypothetical protein ILA06_10505 [Bacteroidaceae bacterium]|nr:hypothetical protein [Bacteroidaceae bacterium]
MHHRFRCGGNDPRNSTLASCGKKGISGCHSTSAPVEDSSPEDSPPEDSPSEDTPPALPS